MQEERVILVNELDEETGSMEKLQAHQLGVLHRAFSVFVFNDQGEVLLQQRAWHKYHSPGLWTNTCCSHPRTGETTEQAAHRRLQEEMGFDCPITFQRSFIYKVQFDTGLYEHELDHVFTGCYNGPVEPNANEVHACKWISWNDLAVEIRQTPELFTFWLRTILEKHLIPDLP